MDPDLAQQKVEPDQDPNCLTLLWYNVFLTEVGFEGKLAGSKGVSSYPLGRELMNKERGFFLMCSLLNNVYMYILRASWKISYYMFLCLCML